MDLPETLDGFLAAAGVAERLKQEYLRGFKDGLKAFAWWKDGVEYVGTCGWTLKDAYEALEKGDLP